MHQQLFNRMQRVNDVCEINKRSGFSRRVCSMGTAGIALIHSFIHSFDSLINGAEQQPATQRSVQTANCVCVCAADLGVSTHRLNSAQLALVPKIRL